MNDLSQQPIEHFIGIYIRSAKYGDYRVRGHTLMSEAQRTFNREKAQISTPGFSVVMKAEQWRGNKMISAEDM